MFDVVLMIFYVTIVLGGLVFIHEGGHYLAARAFGVRVTEFMLGLPGPSIGFTVGRTRFGVTAIPLGGYARVCGMEPGAENPHLERALAFAYDRGTVDADDLAEELGISVDEAIDALYVLVEWGSLTAPKKTDEFNTFRTPALRDRRRHIDEAEGTPRWYASPRRLYESERAQTYRALPFWKRSVILLAGIFVNLLFAVAVFMVAFSVVGVDMVDAQGAVFHVVVPPADALAAGINYIGMVGQAILGLFNPQTAAATVEGSTSIVGMAVLSKTYADAGPLMFAMFMAMLSVSLGLMNLLPIPPLDGGRFVVEIFQKLARRPVGPRVMNAMSVAGLVLFAAFFVFMLNQDIQRFVFGNW